MQRQVMAKHVERGDLLVVNGALSVVTHVEVKERSQTVTIHLDNPEGFRIVRTYSDTVWRKEAATERR